MAALAVAGLFVAALLAGTGVQPSAALPAAAQPVLPAGASARHSSAGRASAERDSVAGPQAGPADQTAPAAEVPGSVRVEAAVRGWLATHPGERAPVLVHLAPAGGAETGLMPANARGMSPAMARTRAGRARYVDALKRTNGNSRERVSPLVAQLAAAGHASEAQGLWLINALALDADPTAVAALATAAGVERISLDDPFPLEPRSPGGPPAFNLEPVAAPPADEPAWNLRDIHADDVWNLLKIDGTGVTVATLDSGVDYHHPNLESRYRGWYGPDLAPHNPGFWWCPLSLCGTGGLYPWDSLGHGTHVLGTILGAQTGVAPGAKWIAGMVCDADGCSDALIIAGMQWVLEGEGERTDPAGVLNLSLEKGGALDYDMKAAVDSVVRGGIVAVVASGNRGQVHSPASFTTTITVGAMDEQRDVPVWSGRGVTPWFEPKPEVVAPGVGIVSTIPGGAYGTNTGTSMATPHVAGVAALMLQAKPDISPDEVKQILKRTATPLAGNVPSGDSGWGLVNAYAAVAALERVGTLRGTVLATSGQLPRWGSEVRVKEADGVPMGSAIPDPTGAFTMALKPGNYLVSASAFGYVSDTARVAIAADEAAQVNLRLPPRTSDAGYFVGAVTDIDGEPLDGRVVLVDTPVEEPFTGGQFAIAGIPPGDYTARIESKGHRVESRQIGIRAGEATRETFQLAGAPTILVVDGDAWHFSGALSYYTSSLDRLGYVYDSWRVLDRELPKLPTVDQMAAYDLVIWTQDFSSPGYLKAGYLLAGYLDKGGRLLLAGQDVACTDSGHAPCAEAWMRQPYLTDRFYADLVDDVATSKAVRGLVGTPLEGIDVTLNGDESLNNQWAPDVVEATNPLHAAISAEYGSGEGAAVFAATCTGYRALLLGFGLEGVNGASSRDRLLGAAIDGLWLPLPPALILEPGADRLIQAAGAAASYTLTLHNTAEVAVPVTVTLSGNGWPTELFKAGFAAPLGERVDAGACEPVEIGVRVTVPSDARRGESDTVTIDARAPAGLPSARTALVTQAPATVLVVDGDMWIPSQETYEGALEAMGVPFDRHVVAPDPSRPSSGGPPTPSTLSLYPIVVWFTGFNPHPSGHLDVPTMQMLAGYLGNGGRLLFASEDHLNFRGATPFEDDRLFQREYLGVDAYYQDVGITALQGAPDTPYADIGPCALRPSGDAIADYFADQLFPGPRAEGILTSSAGRIAATRYFSGTAKTVFMAFDPSKLDGKCAEPAIDRSIDWFSRLTESDLVADRTSYASGDTVHLSLQLIGDGPKDTEDVTVRWVLPNAGVPVRLPGAPWRYDPAIRTILWSGSVLRGHPVHVEADVVLDADLPEGLGQSSDVEIYDGDGITLRRTAAWRVNVADLTASDKTVNRPGPVDRGDIVRFTISVRNRGSLPVPTFTVTDTLPDGLELLERSITRPAGELVDVTPHRVVWRSSVDAGGQASLSYDARITTLAGGYLENIARVDDGSGAPMTLSARVLVRPNLLFPWVGQSAQLPRR